MLASFNMQPTTAVPTFGAGTDGIPSGQAFFGGGPNPFIFKPDPSMPVFTAGTNDSAAATTNGYAAPVPSPGIPVASVPFTLTQSDEPTMPTYEQTGTLIFGPGAQKELPLLGIGLVKLGSRASDDVTKAKKYAMEQSIKHVLMKQTLAHQQQALSLMSRVYIGSISFELREETVKNAFAPFGPIKSINMSWDPITGHHKGFAFLEYEVPEAAMLAQEQMNGVLIGGRNIKVGRPSNMPQAQPIIDAIQEEAKRHNRVYIASVHQDLCEADVKSVFEAFGKIISCQLAKVSPQPNAKHKGFGYIEYEEPQSSVEAVASMNLFDLGGQYLRVGRAITPPQAQTYLVPSAGSTLPTAAAVAAAAATAKIQAMEAAESQRPSGGLSTAPKVVISGQPGELSTSGGVPMFTVPPPGLAIPQLPTSIPAPEIVMPTLCSRPGTETNSPSTSRTSSPSVQQPESPQTLLPVQSEPNFTVKQAAVSTPAYTSQDTYTKLPVASVPEKAAVQSVSQKTNSAAPTQPQPSANAALLRSADAVAQKLMQNPMLSEKQKQLIEMEASQTIAAQEDLKIKGNEARNILMHKLMRRTESCVLVLRNMVGPEDVDDCLEEEVMEECSRFGQVDQVVIYHEKQGVDFNAQVVVKIFVRFSLPQEAETAKSSLDGRYFGGRIIKAEVYDQHLFEANDLSC